MGFLNNLFHKNDDEQTKKTVFIEGMMCQHCVNMLLKH